MQRRHAGLESFSVVVSNWKLACLVPGMKTDTEVIARAFAGDSESLDALFAPLMPYLRRIAFRVLRRDEDVDDAVQDALLLAVKNLRQFEGRSQFSTWLSRIVLNAAFATLRGHRARRYSTLHHHEEGPTWEEMLPGRDLDPEQLYAQKEQALFLRRKIRQLPPIYSTTVMLRHIEEYTTEEAAATLGIRLPALKTRNHRGLARLASSMRCGQAS
jgi:RNA polymerase sigma-70 factor (ECF subfamily)